MQSGALAGGIAAALTNPLEAITVAKQTNPLSKVGQIIREEGMGLLTKGLTPRITYNVC
jgi:solute carrier family 25 iron transporter 28/37